MWVVAEGLSSAGDATAYDYYGGNIPADAPELNPNKV